MRKTIIFLFVAASLTGLNAACRQNSMTVEQSIQSGYNQFNQAWKSKDIKKVEDVFSPECKFKQADEAQVMTLPRFMKGIEFSFRALTIDSAATRIDSLKLKDDTAEVIARINTETRLTFPETPGGPPPRESHKMTQVVRDTWKKTPDGWRIVMRIIEG